MPVRSAFATRLTHVRETRGLSQTALAAAIGSGVTASQIRRWEAGVSHPPSTLRGALAAALDVPKAWLLDGIGPSPFPPRPGEPGYDTADPDGTPMRLRDARLARGYTIEQLAGLAGMTPQMVRGIEAGASEATAASLTDLAGPLGVTPDWLAGRVAEGGLRKPDGTGGATWP